MEEYNIGVIGPGGKGTKGFSNLFACVEIFKQSNPNSTDENLEDYLMEKFGANKIRFNFIYPTHDYGGSTGVLLKAMDEMILNNEYKSLNEIRKFESKLFFPPGDIRNGLEWMIKHVDPENGEYLSSKLGSRFNSLEEGKETFIELLDLISNRSDKNEDEVIAFLIAFYNDLEKYFSKVEDLDIAHSIGNILLIGLQIFYKFDQGLLLQNLKGRYRLVPELVNLYLLADGRTTLVGETVSGVPIIGEENLDVESEILKPSSLIITTPVSEEMNQAERHRYVVQSNTGTNRESVPMRTQQILKKSILNLILFGSEANSLPIINTYPDLVRDKILIRVANHIQTPEAMGIFSESVYYRRIFGLKLIVLASMGVKHLREVNVDNGGNDARAVMAQYFVEGRVGDWLPDEYQKIIREDKEDEIFSNLIFPAMEYEITDGRGGGLAISEILKGNGYKIEDIFRAGFKHNRDDVFNKVSKMIQIAADELIDSKHDYSKAYLKLSKKKILKELFKS